MSSRNEPVLEFMKTRRSVPAKFLGEPGPSDAEIREIVAIASRVPDHAKLAPWRFIAYRGAIRAKLGETILQRALERDPTISGEQQDTECDRFLRSPVILAVVSVPREHPKVPEWEQVLSAGAATMNLVIAANALGYDANWITEWISFDEKLAPALGLVPGERIAGFVHLGTRTAPKSERDRPETDRILTFLEG